MHDLWVKTAQQPPKLSYRQEVVKRTHCPSHRNLMRNFAELEFLPHLLRHRGADCANFKTLRREELNLFTQKGMCGFRDGGDEDDLNALRPHEASAHFKLPVL